MQYIYNKKNQIVIGVTNSDLYYTTEELDDSMIHRTQQEEIDFFDEVSGSLAIEYIKQGGFRLITILQLQVDLGNIDNVDFILNKIKKYSKEWEITIEGINTDYALITLYEKEGSGHASAWNDKLYISKDRGLFELTSCREPYLSASEIIDYYGLEDDEFWDVTLDNGEMILINSQDIKSSHDLIKNIKLILTNEEQWNIPEAHIDWTIIIDSLISNKETESIGKELQIIIER